MGSRGASAGGSGVPSGWKIVDYKYGIPVLQPTNPKQSLSLPSKSNIPGVSYILLDRNGNFKQMRIYGEDNNPVKDIDYHPVNGKQFLHKHEYINGVRQKEHTPLTKSEHDEYDKFLE